MLKNLHCLLERNPIYAEDGGFGGITLQELYEDASKYELPTTVPEGVQRSFDAARHAYIYSYFSYDLLTPGVGQLFASLELALHKRLGIPWNGKSGTSGLFNMLTHAKNKNLISSEFGVLHKVRNIFQHGTENIIDPNFFLDMLETVTVLVSEMYEPKGMSVECDQGTSLSKV